jgi:hypothetical protein
MAARADIIWNRRMALTLARAVALVAAGLVLIAAGLTQPRITSPAADVHELRPATQAEEAAWQRQRLADALTEARRQQ